MRYEYSGYLKLLLKAPDPTERDQLDHVEFGPQDLKNWTLTDDEAHREWQNVIARCIELPRSVVLRGEFEDMRRLEMLPDDDPSFWAPLSTRKWRDARLPIDLHRFPIVEITYRCPSRGAIPGWSWSYAGGTQSAMLTPTDKWTRTACLLQHAGFPERLDALTIRLYATSRTTEELEVESIRFRAMSAVEKEACLRKLEFLEELGEPPNYPLLDNFMPMGVYMKVGAAKNLADVMGISFRDYWRLALEDVARYHHNAVAIEECEQLSHAEMRELLGLAASFNIRLLPMFDWPMDEMGKRGRALVDEYIRPHADSPAILGWSVCNEPPEQTFLGHIEARAQIEAADPNHPLVVLMREANAYALFAPHFAASGLSHFQSSAAWELGEMVYTHYPLSRGQQFWVTAPSFVYGTETPGWNSCPEMRLMLNQAFANGARGWFAFSYHNEPIWSGGSFIRSLTGPCLTFSDLWSELGHRMERFTGLAPLFLAARPSGPAEVGFKIAWEAHPRSRRPEGVDPIQWHWLRGDGFSLLYIVSNDIGEVTSVNIEAPAHLGMGTEIYDMTEFVRTRNFVPMPRKRHLEMFPGQGEVILIAESGVAEQWRDRCAEALMENDRRQIALDLSLARRYNLDVARIQRHLQHSASASVTQEFHTLKETRDHLTNLLYSNPELVVPRSHLVRASAAICGCDGTLCRMMGAGKSDLALELGEQVLPLMAELTGLRLKLRRGHGAQIVGEAESLGDNVVQLMNKIRSHI